jgi:hypothetical protein
MMMIMFDARKLSRRVTIRPGIATERPWLLEPVPVKEVVARVILHPQERMAKGAHQRSLALPLLSQLRGEDRCGHDDMIGSSTGSRGLGISRFLAWSGPMKRPAGAGLGA